MQDFKFKLKAIGFNLTDGETDVWVKKYKRHNDYIIRVLLKNPIESSTINYGNEISFDRATTSNFSNPENIVVLECVDRLLEKGYSPKNIVLEKKWQLGHKEKGYLDIMVLDRSGKSFLMIECKNPGLEHKKERTKTQLDGGQLFSYFIQEKTTKYLCLYSSLINTNGVSYENDIVVVNDLMQSSNNQQDAFEAWNPQVFEKRGLFDSESNAYDIVFHGIKKGDLLPLSDGDDVYNRFAEILRRNVVSDKTNAFNKIFNLFLCKIVDEFESQDNEITKFQWQESETSETVMLRLNDLYKKGMERYLSLKISAVTLEELEEQLTTVGTQDGKEAIKNLFIQQKLYTGNEFAFMEVFDKETFLSNSIIVKEVVKLLEIYRIKYSSKQQFLGDFFEKLLNTGIKQEAGQFFTPIPIARFICKSIPVENIIHVKNESREERFLPYCIDYASGSGHFLTEIMAEVNKYVESIEEGSINGGERAKNKFISEKKSFQWAQEYVYGIEKDYRLAKTTKISTFLNGDGEATIICADGLDNFRTSKDYKGMLGVTTDGVNNEQFDVLVANPPYSVSGFKTTLNRGKETFSLYDSFTDQSSEIEVLFVERAKQLLKKGGYAGIILPSSILSNPQVYQKARELILKNFEIKGLVELGQNTFMATGTKTVILFLRKRDSSTVNKYNQLVDSFYSTFSDFDCNAKENVVAQYVNYLFNDLNFTEYINFFKGYNSPIENHEIFQEYKNLYATSDKKSYIDHVITLEKEKLLYFLLSADQKVVLVNSGEKESEKDFLGYEFSNRRGHEGIRIFDSSLLYSESDTRDEAKVNSYVLRNCLGEAINSVDEGLKKYVKIVDLIDLMDFSSSSFEKKISGNNFKKKILTNYKLPSDKLGNLLKELQSGSRPSGGVSRIKDGVPSLGGEHIDIDGTLDLESMKYVPEKFFKSAKHGEVHKSDILVCKDGAQTGKVAFVSSNYPYVRSMANEHLFILRSNGIIDQNYLFYFLLSDLGQALLKINVTGAAQGGLNRSNLQNIRVPLVESHIQKNTLEKIKPLEIEHTKLRGIIAEIESKIIETVRSNFSDNEQKFGKFIKLEYGEALPERSRKPGTIDVVGANGAIGRHNDKLVAGPAIVVGRKGSVGKVNWFDKSIFPIDTTFWVQVISDEVSFRYCYFLLKSLKLTELNDGLGPGGLNRNTVYNLQVGLPNQDIQAKVVAEANILEKQKAWSLAEIEKLESQISNYILSDAGFTREEIQKII